MVVARARRAPPAGRRVVKVRVGGVGLLDVSCGVAAMKILGERDEEEDGGMNLLSSVPLFVVGKRLMRCW